MPDCQSVMTHHIAGYEFYRTVIITIKIIRYLCNAFTWMVTDKRNHVCLY